MQHTNMTGKVCCHSSPSSLKAGSGTAAPAATSLLLLLLLP
jgi:hypothetical protein